MSPATWTPPKGWRWMPGMLTDWSLSDSQVVKARVTAILPTDLGFDVVLDQQDELGPFVFAVEDFSGTPDFTDPATLGCLRQLVLDAWGVETVDVYHNSDSGPPGGPPFFSWWCVGRFNHFRARKAEGEFGHSFDDFDRLWALGLLAALEAAPC